jgi:hypothetical protein
LVTRWAKHNDKRPETSVTAEQLYSWINTMSRQGQVFTNISP